MANEPGEEFAHLSPHQRDATKESKILLWIWNTLEEVGTTEFENFIRDGVILCRMMNKIKPGCIKGDLKPGTTHKEKRMNIEKYIQAAHEYGVPRERLFPVEDLLYVQHLPRVAKSIYALGSLADADENYTGPKLGEEPFEAAGKSMRRQGCLPIGDDIAVAHVNTKWLRQKLPEAPTS